MIVFPDGFSSDFWRDCRARWGAIELPRQRSEAMSGREMKGEKALSLRISGGQ
jgi:hypothetical protein